MEREFVVLPTFEKQWKDLKLSEEDLRALENAILENPDGAPAIAGTGGIRKIRIPLPGRGKRGGARALYVDFVAASQVFFLAVYAKNEQADLRPEEKKILKQLVEELKQQ